MNVITLLKRNCLVVFLLISAISFSQERVINLGDFNIIKVYSGVTLELVRGDEQKMVIIGEKKENIAVKNVNGKLKVYLKFPEIYDDEKVIIKLHHKEDINIIDANEGAAIFSDLTIKQQNVTIRSQEGAYIHLVLDSKYISVKAISGANIRLRGKVLNQEVEVTTGGVYEGYELDSESTEVVSASGARAEINTSNTLNARVRFGGIINYKGNPEKVTTKKLIGGKIKNKG